MGQTLLGQVILAVIGSLIGSFVREFFVEMATRIVVKIRLPFWQAYRLAFGSALPTAIIGPFLIRSFGLGGYVAVVILWLVISWFIFANHISTAEGKRIGAFPGLLVALVDSALSSAMIAAFAGIGLLYNAFRH
jgi:hypothetical protein